MYSLLAATRILAEGGESAGPLEGLGINAIQVLAQIINFLLIMWFLNSAIIQPLLKNLENRKKKVEDSLENARKADERLGNVEKDYQAKLSEAGVEAQKVRGDALAVASTEASRLRAEAQGEAERIKAQARVDATAERNQLLADSRSQIVSLVMSATNKLIGDSMDSKRQESLITDFFAKVPANIKVGSEKVSITSALPLTDSEKAKVLTDLGAANADFDVNPSILGGIVVRIGDRIIDGSVQSKVNALGASLRS